jgi:beta-phosphoglucomutase
MAEIRAFLFDMDGVILDSNPLHRQSWIEYNRRHGVETTEAMQQEMYGKRNDMIVRDYLGAHLTDAEVTAHGAAKETLYRELLAPRIEETLVPGLVGFLERHSHIPAAVATNAEPANVEFVLRAAGIARFFRVAVDGHQVANPKPHPDVYLRAAELLGVPPANCVVFEDSHGGVAAGLAARMRVVGITTTYADLPGASILVRDFNDQALEAWLAPQLAPKACNRAGPVTSNKYEQR